MITSFTIRGMLCVAQSDTALCSKLSLPGQGAGGGGGIVLADRVAVQLP